MSYVTQTLQLSHCFYFFILFFTSFYFFDLQIADAENNSELQATLAIHEAQNIILETGFRKPFKNNPGRC